MKLNLEETVVCKDKENNIADRSGQQRVVVNYEAGIEKPYSEKLAEVPYLLPK